jgi:hypothetical protein
MDYAFSKTLIETYIEGWLKGDKDLVLSVLSPEITIGQYSGPIVSGKNDVAVWFKEWLESKGEILRWDVVTFFYIRETAVYEWELEARVEGHTFKTHGMSLAVFRHDEIISIREYCKTKHPYPWTART